MTCLWHCCNNKLTGKQLKFCNPKCRNKYNVDRIRKRTKQKAIDYKGGCCSQCGYNKCITALVFHHRDSANKDFEISGGRTISWERIKQEIEKCDLLCSNCHAEAHQRIQEQCTDGVNW